ncbi:MAG: hypothetical protein AAF196_03885 [Planctomycetota bacterium]
MERIPEALLDRSVDGLNLSGLNLGGATLRKQFAEGPNLWVFLRHFG